MNAPDQDVALGVADDDDLRLFESLVGIKLAREILSVKHNDPRLERLKLEEVHGLDRKAWRRLGCILGENTFVKHVYIAFYGNTHAESAALCDGLKNNRHIQCFRFHRVDLRDVEKMNSLAGFLTNSPSLTEFALRSCNISSTGIEVVAHSLMNSSEYSLQRLDLDGVNFGDAGVDLGCLVPALIKCEKLSSLWLNCTGIGTKGCISLGRLLQKQESNLIHLYLDNNSINDEAVRALADALAKNTRLSELSLCRNRGITAAGFLALMELACNGSGIKSILESNHELHDVGYYSVAEILKVVLGFGADDANLLFASLKTNIKWNKASVIKRKIIWSHARGSLDLGQSSIHTGVMPRVLSWFGDDSNEANANLIQYHDPPLPKVKIDTVRLDSVYRILRSMPDLCDSQAKKRKA